MKVTIVMVLYNCELKKSKTFQTFLKHKKRVDDLNLKYDFIIYDNTMEKQNISQEYQGDSFSYVHDPRNLGIGAAYNYAWEKSRKNGNEWLLLLDQDTTLKEEYLSQIFRKDKQHFNPDIVAIVPQILSNGILVSPLPSNKISRKKATEKMLDEGVPSYPLTAINSGAMIKVNFLTKIGGFNKEFPLDYLDHWLFHKIQSLGYNTYVISSVLEHELSVTNYDNVSLERYKSILNSELLFYSKYKKEMYKEFKKHLIPRFIKQLLLFRNKRIAFYTFFVLLSVIFSCNQRIADR